MSEVKWKHHQRIFYPNKPKIIQNDFLKNIFLQLKEIIYCNHCNLSYIVMLSEKIYNEVIILLMFIMVK